MVIDIATEVAPHVEGMTRLMIEKRGIGLAAPQVGIGLRFFVSQILAWPVAVNPHYAPILDAGRMSGLEGCLSWPGLSTYVARYQKIYAQWIDLNGHPMCAELSGLAARVFQHETDHLLGITIFP